MTSRARRGGFYLNDHLGSARVVVNAQTGQVADFHWYYAYGAPLGEQTSTGQSYKYTGKPYYLSTFPASRVQFRQRQHLPRNGVVDDNLQMAGLVFG